MDEDQEPTIRFTDEEAAFLRYARFGELPKRVPPAELVELAETDVERNWGTDTDLDRNLWPAG